MDYSDRAGKHRRMDSGYVAFFPNPLPPEPALEISDDLLHKLQTANRALGRLDGTSEILPDTDMFVYMYVRKEAVLSSQIEGTQASLIDVLGHEAEEREPEKRENNEDITEVVNYIEAMQAGLKAIESGPITLDLIKSMHAILLQSGRGSKRKPGEFRDIQNWVGSSTGGIRNATYVPPPPEELANSLGQLETWLQTGVRNNVLIGAGLAHVQFETIHPFLDGNGRIGRLLLTLLMVENRILSQPLLYLSYYFKHRRVEYYDRLQAVRDFGDWEGWIGFYLQGLIAVAEEAADTAKSIVRLREADLQRISSEMKNKSGRAIQLLEHLFHQPVVNVHAVQQLLGEGYQAANRLINSLEKMGILKEMTGQQRNRKFGYAEYIRFFEDEEEFE